MILEVLSEGMDYVVRAGSEVFVRPEGSEPSAWRPEVLRKVTYFSFDDVVRAPNPNRTTDAQQYVFRRDGMLYGVDGRQLRKI